MFRQFTDTQIISALLFAAQWTILLSLIAFAGGSVLGALLTYARVMPNRWLAWLAGGFSGAVQSTPLLMLLFLTFFGLPMFGIPTSALLAAAFGLILFSGAFLNEIWTSAIKSVPSGQWEAARSAGLSFMQTLQLVIAPQALRLALPSTVGFCVQIVKGTAVASIIGFIDITRTGRDLNNAAFRPFFIFTVAALIYFCLCFPLSWASRRLEARLGKI